MCFFFQAEDGIRDFCQSRGLGDVYKEQSQLELKGDGYLLTHSSLQLPDSALPVIDHAGLIALIAEHGPCTSWY